MNNQVDSDKSTDLINLNQSSRIIDINEIKVNQWSHVIMNKNIRYNEIINYNRSNQSHSLRHCVMCGSNDAEIPSQNKDVCKICDISIWFIYQYSQYVKFCKGCKNFIDLSDFEDKPNASKCYRCRERGRINYISKKIDKYSNLSPIRQLIELPSPKSIAFDDSYNYKLLLYQSNDSQNKTTNSAGKPPVIPSQRSLQLTNENNNKRMKYNKLISKNDIDWEWDSRINPLVQFAEITQNKQ